jgi:2'-5' RNA ligase
MRLFVAVWPPADVVAGLADLSRPSRAGVRWTTPDQWHVTLRFFGSVHDPEDGKRALAQLASPGATVATAGPAVERLGPSILCLPVAGLDELAACVVEATASVGTPPDGRPFRGHITLARAKRGVTVGPLAGETFNAAWPVDEVTLVASDTRPDRAHYTLLERYPVGS